MKLHEELKKLRISQDMSCKQLADKIGVNPTYLANVESGLKPYNQIMLNKVLAGLNLPTIKYGFEFTIKAKSNHKGFEQIKPLLREYVIEQQRASNEAIRKLTDQSLTDCSGEGN